MVLVDVMVRLRLSEWFRGSEWGRKTLDFHSLHNSNVFDVIVCLLPGAWRYFLHIVLSLLTTRYGFQKFYTMSALEQRGRDAPARLYTISL
jgi:hypothetical protein